MRGLSFRTIRLRPMVLTVRHIGLPQRVNIARYNSTTSQSSRISNPLLPRRSRSLRPLYLALTLLAGSVLYARTLPTADPSPSLAKTPLTSLLRSYAVWTLISFPSLVDASPAVLDFTFKTNIPLIRPIGEFVIRNTFFPQFIPGESAQECLPGLQEMRRRNVGHALNYSAEGDTLKVGTTGKGKGEEQVKSAMQMRYEEVERALDVQGEFERQMEQEGWAKGSSAFALKVTGLIDPQTLIRASNAMHRLHEAQRPRSKADKLALSVIYPGSPQVVSKSILAPSTTSTPTVPQGAVTRMRVLENDLGLQEGDIGRLKQLWERLDSLAARAKRNGVRFILDAEETCYQPALDGYTQLLSMKYNKPPVKAKAVYADDPTLWIGPIVYGTYQSYLTRQPAFLEACIAHAEENGYALGLKVVRGGYIVKETKMVQQPGREGVSPVWPSKAQTDQAYNDSVKTIITSLAKELSSKNPRQALSVIFGTHNRDSVDMVITQLESNGLAKNGETGRLKLRDDVVGRVGIAQLYGMREDLSDVIAETFEQSKLPMSLKFVAYGRLLEVLPFLGRRAVENKSIMSGPGGAAAERRRVGGELRRRFWLD